MTATPTLVEIRDQIRALVPFLAERYQVESIELFGSYVRGENRADSDLDVLVTFAEVPGLLRFMELEHYLSDTLGLKVDLVMKDSLKPEIGRRILEEAVLP